MNQEFTFKLGFVLGGVNLILETPSLQSFFLERGVSIDDLKAFEKAGLKLAEAYYYDQKNKHK